MTLSATEQALISTAFLAGMSWMLLLWGYTDKNSDGWQCKLAAAFMVGVALGWAALASLGMLS